MTIPGNGRPTSRLRALAQRATAAQAAGQQCEACSLPIPPEHRHLLDVQGRKLLCACRACTILFDRSAAGGGHFRLIPSRRVRLTGFELDALLWARLSIPVDMAFFVHRTPVGRMTACYPSPMGITESSVELDAWQEVETANPVLSDMEPDVDALLVNRARGAREHWLVPVDDCYRLVAVVRIRWQGFTGGQKVWEEIAEFFEQLKEEARV